MTSRLQLMAGAIVLAGTIAPLAGQSTQPRERDPGWLAPAGESERANPLAGLPALSAGGGKLFKQRCSECHGLDARGTTRAPDLHAADVQAQTDGSLFWKISSGNTRSGMPSFSFLPAQQRWQLVLFLRSR